MTLVKREKIWYYQTKINGKTWKRSTWQTEKRQAERVSQQFKAEATLRKRALKNSQRLSQAISEEVARIETDISPSQAERALYSLSEFLTWLGKDQNLTEITDSTIEAFQRHRLQSVSLGTVRKDLNFLLRLLRENGIHIPAPSPKRGRHTEIRPFSSQELATLFTVLTPACRALYATLLTTGARPAELVPSKRSSHKPLLKTEVDFVESTVTIRQAKGRSLQTTRTRPPLPIPHEVLDLLARQIQRMPEAYPFVFQSNSNLARDFDLNLTRAGIDKIDGAGRKLILHSFRHTYATLMAGQVHNNPHFLKSILGHARISTTDRYCQVVALPLPLNELGHIPFATPDSEKAMARVIPLTEENA